MSLYAKMRTYVYRCFVFDGPIELAWHNNLYRAFIEPSLSSLRLSGTPPSDLKEQVDSADGRGSPREIVPYIAFTGFQSAYEGPKVDEGFTEVRSVRWRFEGGELERKAWDMWLQVSGK